ncbi:hypothetical protein BB561_007025, partial [Smittium simulii]
KKPIKAFASTWVSGTTRWLNKYTNKVKSGATKNTISDRYNKNNKSKIYIFIKTHNIETTRLKDIGKIQTGLYWSCEKLEWFSQPFSKQALKQLTSHFWEVKLFN